MGEPGRICLRLSNRVKGSALGELDPKGSLNLRSTRLLRNGFPARGELQLDLLSRLSTQETNGTATPRHVRLQEKSPDDRGHIARLNMRTKIVRESSYL